MANQFTVRTAPEAEHRYYGNSTSPVLPLDEQLMGQPGTVGYLEIIGQSPSFSGGVLHVRSEESEIIHYFSGVPCPSFQLADDQWTARWHAEQILAGHSTRESASFSPEQVWSRHGSFLPFAACDQLLFISTSTEMFEEPPYGSPQVMPGSPMVVAEDVSNTELLEDLQLYERQFGLSSQEFYYKWRAHEFEDSYEANRWAVLYRYAKELRLL